MYIFAESIISFIFPMFCLCTAAICIVVSLGGECYENDDNFYEDEDEFMEVEMLLYILGRSNSPDPDSQIAGQDSQES